MSNYLLPDMASVSDLQRQYASLVDKVQKSDKPLLILRKNKLEAVLLNPYAYQELIDKVRLYEEKKALEAISSYEIEKKAGKLRKLKKVDELFD